MLRFLSLTVEDFGPYKNRQTIDFTSDDGVTIIWGIMVGKTTLLNAFRYALFGKCMVAIPRYNIHYKRLVTGKALMKVNMVLR